MTIQSPRYGALWFPAPSRGDDLGMARNAIGRGSLIPEAFRLPPLASPRFGTDLYDRKTGYSPGA